jgi:predicted lipoprotein with Yx(FWY)xxD motif
MTHRTAAAARPLTLIGLVVLVAACTAAGSPSEAPPSAAASAAASAEASEAASMAPSAEPSAMASEAPADATVVVAESEVGQILTDADGRTVYYFANDTEGVSNCEGDCLANWPAVTVQDTPSGGDGVDAEIGAITRSDGTVQLTVNGFPAYYFAADEAAGDTNGQGVGDVWWVFGPDGEPIEI